MRREERRWRKNERGVSGRMPGESKTLAAAVGLRGPTPPLVGMARYEILRPIGRGGMGVVYEALDRQRQRLVALKTLRHFTPAALYLFKREFRALADVHHPNLVHLHELVVSGNDGAFFTMELVRGTDFLSHLQRQRAGLRPALRQLVDGIRALHRAGKLHRDIKPSNVRVTPEGRVVLLDFGIATELAPTTGDAASEAGETAGTARYMAPELSEGQRPTRPTPASDWYSVGIMLDEALGDAAAPDLEALRTDLLRRDPAHRPDGAEIARRLLAADERAGAAPAGPISPATQDTFVGRAASLQALQAAFEAVERGASITVRLAGSPGMGKSTLARRFLDETAARALVLRGRAYERESVPYKAMDSVVDALSRHLMRLDRDGCPLPLPAEASALVRLFPVLRRVPALRDLAAPSIEEPQRIRHRAFAALRQLLRSLSRSKPLVLFIDDVQWGDADSATLVVELMRPPEAPSILLVAAYREEEAERSPFLVEIAARWPVGAEVRSVQVEPLDPREARQLALGHPGTTRRRLGREHRAGVGREPAAHRRARALRAALPRICGQAGRSSQSRRLAALSGEARRMLDVVSVGGRPLPLSVVAEASGVQGGPARRSRWRGSTASSAPGCATDTRSSRRPMAASATSSSRRYPRRRSAIITGDSPGPLSSAQHVDPEAVAVHFLGAGDAEQGAHFAERAAEQAAGKLAFERAARLFRLALENLPDPSAERCDLHARLGEVLEWAGRGSEAARAYLEAAQRAGSAATRVQLERAAAEQLLTSGRIDEGAAVLRRVLVAAGTRAPRTPLGAIVCLLFYRVLRALVGLGFERRDQAATERDRLRIDALHSFVIGFSIVDVVVATCVQARCLMLALRSGSSVDVMRAASIELTHVASQGGPVGKRERTLAGIIDSLAEQSRDAEWLAFVHASRGAALLFRGRWREALEMLDGAYAGVAARRAGWQSNANLFAAYALYSMGDLQALGPRQARVLADAELRGDLYTEVSLRTVTAPVLCLAADDPDAARRHVRDAMAQWSHRGFLLQHWQAARAEAEIELYVGDAAAACARLERDAKALRRSFLLASQFLRISHASVRGRCAIAAAAADPHRRAERLALARRIARSLWRERAPHGAPLAAILSAGVASIARDRAGAARHLRGALALGRSADMSLHVEAARYQLGRVLGGDEGRDLVARAEAALAAQGVRAPLHFASMIAPGFDEPRRVAPSRRASGTYERGSSGSDST